MDERERGGRDAGDAAGLADGHGADALEGFAHLAREAADGAVLEPVGDGDGLGGLETRDGLLLLLEVAGEFDFGFDGAGFVAAGGAEDGGLRRRGPFGFAQGKLCRHSRPGGRRYEFVQQRVAGEVVAEGGEERLDGDFRALEELRPGEAGSGGELAKACALQLFGVDFASCQEALECGHAGLLLLVLGPGLRR